ncbi:MAG: hypothetical protein ABIG30_00445 [Candidatus Aenigmatarchaeota archaeon]
MKNNKLVATLKQAFAKAKPRRTQRIDKVGALSKIKMPTFLDIFSDPFVRWQTKTALIIWAVALLLSFYGAYYLFATQTLQAMHLALGLAFGFAMITVFSAAIHNCYMERVLREERISDIYF